MNNLAYNSQSPDVVGEKVAELVKEETGAAAPYTVQDANASATSAKTVVLEGLDLLFGGRKNVLLFSLNFDIQTPREMFFSVPISRQGVGSHGGQCMYMTPLSTEVGGEIVLAPPKFLGGMKFEGEGGGPGKLNANGELMKRLKNWVRTKVNLGGVDMSCDQNFRIVPDPDGGCMLLSINMPRTYKMGLAVAFDFKEFAEIARMIESTL